MQKTITIPGWLGHLGRELAPRELEATLYAVAGMRVKEIAKPMGISPATVTKRLEDARGKLGSQRNLRGLVSEALRRQIIVPLAAMLLLIGGGHQQLNTVRRPEPPRTYSQARVVRKVDSFAIAA